MFLKITNKDLYVAVLLFCCELSLCSKLESIWTPHVDCSATSQNPCVLLPTICQPGGKCVAQGCSYKCVCEGGHEGSNCQPESLPSPSKPVNQPTGNGETEPKRLDIFVGNGALNFLDNLLKNTTPEAITAATPSTQNISQTTTESSAGDVNLTTDSATTTPKSGHFPFMGFVQAQVQHKNYSLSNRADITTESNRTEIISTAMENTTGAYEPYSTTMQKSDMTSTPTTQHSTVTTSTQSITITSTEVSASNLKTVSPTSSISSKDSFTEESTMPSNLISTSSVKSTTTLPTTTMTSTIFPVIVSKEPAASSSLAEVNVTPTQPPTTTNEFSTSTVNESSTLSSTISTQDVNTTVSERPPSPSTTSQTIASTSEETIVSLHETTKSETAVIDEILSALTTLTGVTSLTSGQPESAPPITAKPPEPQQHHSSPGHDTIVSAAAPTNHKNTNKLTKISTKHIGTDTNPVQSPKSISRGPTENSSTPTTNVQLPVSTTPPDSTEKAKSKNLGIRKALKKGRSKERETISKGLDASRDQSFSDNALSMTYIDSSMKESPRKSTLKENKKTVTTGFDPLIDSLQFASTTESSSQENSAANSTESMYTTSDSRSQESTVDSSDEPLIFTTTIASQDQETVSSPSTESSDLATSTKSQNPEVKKSLVFATTRDSYRHETTTASSPQKSTTDSRSKRINVNTTSDVLKDKDEKSDNLSTEDTSDDKMSQSPDGNSTSTTVQVTLDGNSDTDDHHSETSVTPPASTKFAKSNDDNVTPPIQRRTSTHTLSSTKSTDNHQQSDNNDKSKKKVRRSTRDF